MTSHPDSIPFLLVRQSMPDDVEDIDAEEAPSSKSVPPHQPPARVCTTDSDLPSVIVTLDELAASEEQEAERASDVDGLLAASEHATLELPIEEEAPLNHRQLTRPSHARSGSRMRGFTIALLAAVAAAGMTFTGLRIAHVSSGSLGAAFHVVR